MSTPKQLARLGQFYLEEAVLDVLLQAAHDKKCLGRADIGKSAGIFRSRGKLKQMNDAIVSGLLIKLHAEEKVEKCTQQGKKRGTWQLTEKEFLVRKDD